MVTCHPIEFERSLSSPKFTEDVFTLITGDGEGFNTAFWIILGGY